MEAKKRRVVVVGAGMAGLTAAHHLHTSAGELFELSILEAGERIGGRIRSSDFAGNRVEFGATWIHGITGSPIHAIANDIGALDSELPWERMDGIPESPLVVAEGGLVIDNEAIFHPINSHFRRLRYSDADPDDEKAHLSLGSHLRSVLKQYQTSRERAGGDIAGQGWNTEALESGLFAMLVNLERTRTAANELDEVDLAGDREYKEFPGEHVTIAKGFIRVVEALAKALPKGTIRFRQRVVRIEWCADDDGPVVLRLEDGTAITAEHVIVTVSLGVLKETGVGGLEFAPELPDFKKGAIGRLGFGVVDKLFLEMDGSGGGGDFPFLLTAFDERRRREDKIPWWMRRTWSIWPIYAGSRVLVTWFTGEEAKEVEKLEEEHIIRGVEDTIDNFLGRDGGGGLRIIRAAWSSWGKDPLFRGSYSYVPVGSSGDDLDLMAEPLPLGAGGHALQILFAGEATHRSYYSTTHGAYLSGKREANRLLQHHHHVTCYP